MPGTLLGTGVTEMNAVLQELTMSGKQAYAWLILMPVTNTTSELYPGQWRTIEKSPTWSGIRVGTKESARKKKKNFLR